MIPPVHLGRREGSPVVGLDRWRRRVLWTGVVARTEPNVAGWRRSGRRGRVAPVPRMFRRAIQDAEAPRGSYQALAMAPASLIVQMHRSAGIDLVTPAACRAVAESRPDEAWGPWGKPKAFVCDLFKLPDELRKTLTGAEDHSPVVSVW